MPTLSALGRKSAALSPALPIYFEPFSKYVKLRKGQFSLWAAAPGVGKSVMATNIAVRSRAVESLFFSADSDEYTVRQRALAIISGHNLATVEKNLKDPSWSDFYSGMLSAVDNVDWCFRTDIDLDFIIRRLNAYAEIRGHAPDLTVVDNLGNGVVDTDNEYSELRTLCRELQAIARESGTHVMALHHVKGIHEQADKRGTPISLGSLQFNLGKIPEIVIGMNSPYEGSVNMSVPKNRGGKGGVEFAIDLDYASATVGGFRSGE